MQLRAEAHMRKASTLSHLAMLYQGKAADLRGRLRGDALIAALAALYSEQKAAERALSAQLAGEARQRQRTVLRELQLRRKTKRKMFTDEARAAAKSPPRRRQRRPRQRRKSTPKGPRARR